MKVYSCRMCQGNLSEPKLKLPSTPLANEFLKTREPQDFYPLEVCVCESCGHYQLNEQVPPEKMFRTYSFVAGTSPVNIEHFRQYAEDMIKTFELLPGSKILDIGSNDGTLLKHFKDLGMDVFGIDPAENIAKIANERGIPTVAMFFNEYVATAMAQETTYDLIVANNVFAHVPDLGDFARGVKRLLAPHGVFSFEVSYFADVCDKALFDTVYAEHTSYHHILPLINLFDKLGMYLFDVQHISNHGGSVRVLVCHREAMYAIPKEDCYRRLHDILDIEMDMPQKVSQLQGKIEKLGLQLREKLREFKDQGKSIAIFGVPAKATTLMYALGIDPSMIDFAVDDAPLKQGTFTPGMHIPVYSSEAIIKNRPDVILVLCWNFSDSVIKNCQARWNEAFGNDRYPTFVTPLPELKVE
jgi:SAM-dependent methyltransferase